MEEVGRANRSSVRPRGVAFTAVVAALSLALLGGGAAVAVAATHHATAKRATNAASATSTTAAARAATTAATTSGAPYAVGVIHLTLVDTSRGSDARGDTPASSVRTIQVTIRYPAVGAADQAEDELVPAAGQFPLVVLAHGYDVSAETYAAMEHELAAAGFIVAAPDFPLTSTAYDGPAIESDVVNQAADVSFVITQLLDPITVPGILLDSIAHTKVGVIGHSDGGVTAAAVAYNSSVADPRIGAAVILSGAEARYPGSWFTTASPPLLAIHGDADEVNPYSSSQQLYDDATGTRYLVTVLGGSHLGPFTDGAARPAVSTLVADFLRAELSGDGGAAAAIAGDANVPDLLALAAHA